MEHLLHTTAALWAEAAHGQTRLVVASLVSSVAFEEFRTIEQRLEMLCDTSEPESVWSKFTEVHGCPGVPLEVPEDMNEPNSELLRGLLRSWHSMQEQKDSGEAAKSEETSSAHRAHAYITLRKGSNSAPMDDDCLKVLLHNIVRHLKNHSPNVSSFHSGSPVVAEVRSFFTGESSGGLQSTFGLRLLLESCKSYFFAIDHRLAPSNCRLRALKFAQEAIVNTSAVLDDTTLPCRCPHTLAFHLENLQLALKSFVHTGSFDLYFQSPWASGSHILCMLEALFYYGLRLFSYRNYVGAVIHIYNTLKEVTDFRSIAVLENLSITFEHILFPGGRPSRHFRACYTRHRGGRLRFNSKSSDHRTRCHSVAVPVHTAKVTAGFGTRAEKKDSRLDYRRTSLLFQIVDKDFQLDNTAWRNIVSPRNRPGDKHSPTVAKLSGCCHDRCSRQDLLTQDPKHRLQSLQQAVTEDFNGCMPVAKVNLFKVYLACVRIISTISKHTHGEQDRPGQFCLCYTDAILSAADRYQYCEDKVQPLGCGELIKICQSAMAEVLEDVRVEDFLWEGI